MRIRNRLLLSVVAMGVLILGAGAASAATSYTVRPGDNLLSISRQFGVSLDSLQATNDIWNDLIYPGETMLIPDGSPKAPAAGSAAADKRAAAPARGQTRNQARSQTKGSSSDDLKLLSHLVYSEARGENYEGQVAVAAVALNRLESGRYGSTLSDVIFEPWAFTATADGQFWLEPDATAYQAAQEALNGRDPTDGALYYFNPSTATSPWIWSRTITDQIGSHLFGY